MGVIRPSTRVSFQPKAQLGVLYTSSRGSTRDAAHAIAVRLGPHVCGAPVDVAALPGLESLSSCEGFIFGTPTYATGASAQRSGTAWDDVLYSGVLRQLSLLRKPFAVFGCGDAARFPENFADAMGEVRYGRCLVYFVHLLVRAAICHLRPTTPCTCVPATPPSAVVPHVPISLSLVTRRDDRCWRDPTYSQLHTTTRLSHAGVTGDASNTAASAAAGAISATPSAAAATVRWTAT
jgi:flavodoxin